MSSLLFKDIGKSQKDLLTKDFPSDKKVEVNSKPRNDLSVSFGQLSLSVKTLLVLLVCDCGVKVDLIHAFAPF